MAISVTEILGTDSLAGSRIVINDNFNILAEEINLMEVYFNPTAGTLAGLNSTTTNTLKVGLSTVKLEITSSAFNIISDVSLIGNLNLEGNLLRNNIDPDIYSDTTLAPSYTANIGSTTAAPEYFLYKVHNSLSSAVTLSLFAGEIGQEIIFQYDNSNTGDVNIIEGTGSAFSLEGNASTITLNGLGQTVHLFSTTDSSGNPLWIIIGGAGYTLS